MLPDFFYSIFLLLGYSVFILGNIAFYWCDFIEVLLKDLLNWNIIYHHTHNIIALFNILGVQAQQPPVKIWSLNFLQPLSANFLYNNTNQIYYPVNGV